MPARRTPTAAQIHGRATSAGARSSAELGAAGGVAEKVKRLEAPQQPQQQQRPGGSMSVSQRIQMFETKSTPCLRQAMQSVGGAVEAASAAPAANGAATGGSVSTGAPIKGCSSYSPVQKPSKEPQPRSQSEMRAGGVRQQAQSISHSARVWRPGSAGLDSTEGGKHAITSSASAGKFASVPAAFTGGQGGSARTTAADGSKRADSSRPLTSEAFERLASGSRRNDVERPKSLKAAEQIRLQEEQRQQAKMQEAAEQARLQEEQRQQAKLQEERQQAKLQQQHEQQQQRLQQQQERERQLLELERELERERVQAEAAAIAAAKAAAATSVPATEAVAAARGAGEETTQHAGPRDPALQVAVRAQPQADPVLSVSLPAEEEQEPEAEASGRLEQQPAPEPEDDFGASSDEEPQAGPPREPPQVPLLRRIELPPKKAEDNYEISEHGSDSENEDGAERDRSGKHIPKWCETYLQDLAKQSDIDPDTIFASKVPRCVLEDIFTDEMYKEVGKNRPKRVRGSSGDWRKDHLARSEIQDYKARMGQVRAWDAEKSM